MASTFTQHSAYDLYFEGPSASDRGLGVMLARDKDATLWQGEHAAGVSSEGFDAVPRGYFWQNDGTGAGYSQRTREITTRTPGGAISTGAYSYAPWTTSVVPGILMPSGKLTQLSVPTAATTGFAAQGMAYGSSYYVTTGNQYVLKIDGSTASNITTVDMGGSVTTKDLAVFKGSLYVSSNGALRAYDGTSVTTGSSGTEVSRLATVNWTISPQIATGGATGGGGSNSDRLIMTDLTGTSFYHVSDADNPLDTADWSGAIKIGDGASYTTQWIVSNNHTVWFATTGGLIACDETGYTPNITEWMKLHYHQSNGGQVVYWNGLVWFAHDSGLVVIPVTGERQDQAERWGQFGAFRPNQAPIFGRPRALAPGTDCLWVGYYNEFTETSYLMRLIFDEDDEVRWSGPEAVFEGEIITLVRRVAPFVTRPWLLIATGDTTVLNGGSSPIKVYRQEQPVSSNPYIDYLNGTGHQFTTSSQIYLPREDFGSTSKKIIERYTTIIHGLGDGRECAIYASVDNTTSYALQGTVSRSLRRTFIPTVNTSGSQWNWRFDMTCTADEPWIFEGFEAGVTIIPDVRNIRSYRVVIASEESLKNGGVEQRDPYAAWKKLEGYKHRKRITMYDQFNQQLEVNMLSAIPHQVYWDERRDSWVLVGTVTVRVVREPARFSSGACYDANAYYGEV